MKKMKNFLTVLSVFLITFTSCEKKDVSIKGSWEYLGEPNFTTGNPVGAKNAEIKMKNRVLHVAYTEIGSLDVDINYFHVQKFENGQWESLTDKELVGYSGMNMDPSIEIDDNSNVYISFSAREPSPNPNQNFISPLTAHKYNGSSWTELGTALHQEGFGSDLALSPNNELYCSYVDAVYEGNPWDKVYLYTKKWNGTAWEDFGREPDQTDDFAETIADNDYVYNLTKKSGAIAVYRNDGNQWLSAAATIPNGGDIYSMQKKILFDSDENLYVTAQFVLGTGEGRENRVI